MNDRVREWALRICFLLLVAALVWTVFLGDLAHLFGAPTKT